MKTPTDAEKRLELPPNRSYMVPGGPYPKNDEPVEVPVLAEFKRGSERDCGYGNKRG